ncbi:YceD family protein [Desertibacillus haloalkaliphilus]|uniref:YceD family protein n=1 Tax=Desertibacillus haloalkaliphilus TaxID=1328930 RepID=UPI001C279458|nr:DUF177 domain-containing protein [Desertibacillus haloalkaliphilus]MBU8907128.1 DUF177 domain-containing protein [Desertibacillus haloalkaliphilus]
MKWTIQQLNALKSKGITFDEILDLSEIKERDREIRNISPVHVKGKAEFSSDMVSFPLVIQGTLTLPCSRTLADVELPFDIHVTENFRLNESYFTEEEDSDDDIHIVEGEQIDLLPYIKEHILLQIPMQIFSEDAEGEAPSSGKDWEVLTEADKKNRIDPRLADLAKFFDK